MEIAVIPSRAKRARGNPIDIRRAAVPDRPYHPNRSEAAGDGSPPKKLRFLGWKKFAARKRERDSSTPLRFARNDHGVFKFYSVPPARARSVLFCNRK